MTQLSAKVWVIIPAAGKGSRMESQVAKQYLRIDNKTIIEHTLSKFITLESVTDIIVALSPDDTTFPQLSMASHKKITTVMGGETRSQSVLAALGMIKNQCESSDWVLVHDAARPCVRLEDVEHLITTLKDDIVGGILGVPVSDTLKQVNPSLTIDETIDRQCLWQAQTPQLFRYDILSESLHLALNLGNEVTDEASALEMSGYHPTVVEGHRDNIKITHPEDLPLAQFILRQQCSSN